jgi:hypothetical protein
VLCSDWPGRVTCPFLELGLEPAPPDTGTERGRFPEATTEGKRINTELPKKKKIFLENSILIN